MTNVQTLLKTNPNAILSLCPFQKSYKLYFRVNLMISYLKKKIHFALLIPILLLAGLMDWQYDEAWSFFDVKKNSVIDIITYKTYRYANNQVINSLYFKFLQIFHFKHPFIYRGLSLIGCFIFIYANFRLVKLLQINKFLLIPIVMGPYLVYFAMGRGYSLSLGLLALSIFHLLNAVYNTSSKNLLLTCLFLGIASVSNFSFVFITNSIFIFIVFHLFRIKHFRSIIGSVLIYSFFFIYSFLQGKKVSDFDLSIIGTKSFISGGTIQSLLGQFSFSKVFLKLGIVKVPMITIGLAFTLLFILCLAYFYKRYKNQLITYLFLIFGFAIVQILISNFFLNTLFPVKRATMFLQYGVLILSALITTEKGGKPLLYIPISIFFLFSIVNTTSTFYDLTKPSITEIIRRSENSSLYNVGFNPALNLENYFNGDKVSLHQNYFVSETITEYNQIKKDNTFILIPASKIDSLTLSKEQILTARNDYLLYHIR